MQLEVIAIFKKFILVSESNARFNIQLVGNMQMYMKISNVFFFNKVMWSIWKYKKTKTAEKMLHYIMMHIISLSSKNFIFFQKYCNKVKKKTPITNVYQH